MTNNQLRINYALKEQHSLKKKYFNNDLQKNSAIKNKKKSGDCRRFEMSKIIKRTKYRINR